MVCFLDLTYKNSYNKKCKYFYLLTTGNVLNCSINMMIILVVCTKPIRFGIKDQIQFVC